jgi:excinuclease ABC subunit C
MVAAVASIEALVCGSRHEAAWLERNVLEGAALPPWNRTPGGQETPAVIVLDRRRPRPGLVLAHLHHEPIAGGSIFGPFLGGLQVRSAVAGLHRLYPLAYTGTRISGTERAMAVERSVTEGDRDTLADALTAVLRRDPAAVAQAKPQLEALRQRAVSAEAFELAARIDGERWGWNGSAACNASPPCAARTPTFSRGRAVSWCTSLYGLGGFRSGHRDDPILPMRPPNSG